MHDSSRIHWLLGWMSLLLISGFLIINLLSYTEFLHILDRSIPLGQLPQQGAALHQELRQVFLVNLGLMLGMIVLALLIFGQMLIRDQQQLNHLAAYDSLTGSLNRQAFEAVCRALMRTSIRQQKPLSAILIDLDHFKQINDAHGHLAGDTVLREVVAIIEQMQRKSDVIARWGGEEFLLLLPDCGVHDAARLADQLRLRIRNHDFNLQPSRTVTLSAGVAEYSHGEQEDDLFRRLDDALYQAKRQGRNRTVIADQMLPRTAGQS